MTIKYLVIGAIIVTLLGSSQIAAASTGFTGDDFKAYHAGRPAINPDFAPDYSCLFDVYQVQCIPGSEQECPRPQFGNNDDSTCFPKTLVDGEWKWMCPEGYHNVDDDETGQCYPNDEECPEWAVFEEANRVGGDLSDSCIEYAIDCDLNEDHPLCNGEERNDGIKVCDRPDHPGYKFCTGEID